MGRYGPYLECGDKKCNAVAHASTANKKNPNDLSLPSQPPRAVAPPLTTHENTTTSAVGLSGPASNATDVIFTAEDVIAFGVGLNGASGGGGGGGVAVEGVATDISGGNEAGEGAWYSAVSLERAVGLLSLPRVVCEHPSDGGVIEAGIGRFGTYVKHNDAYKMVPSGVDVLDVDAALAIELVDELIQVHCGGGGFLLQSFWERCDDTTLREGFLGFLLSSYRKPIFL